MASVAPEMVLQPTLVPGETRSHSQLLIPSSGQRAKTVEPSSSALTSVHLGTFFSELTQESTPEAEAEEVKPMISPYRHLSPTSIDSAPNQNLTIPQKKSPPVQVKLVPEIPGIASAGPDAVHSQASPMLRNAGSVPLYELTSNE